jgi:hypothetical protein
MVVLISNNKKKYPNSSTGILIRLIPSIKLVSGIIAGNEKRMDFSTKKGITAMAKPR